MSYKLEINSNDVSDYVVDIDNVPIYNRNLTGESVCESITVKLVNHYSISANKNDEVVVKWGSYQVYVGYVVNKKTTDNAVFLILEVDHFVKKLDSYKVNAIQLEDKIRDVANWTGAKTFLPSDVNTSNNTIEIVNHGFTTGDIVTVKSTDTLPGELITNYQYEVGVIDSKTIQLLYPISGAPGSGIVELFSQGTGTHYITTNINFTNFVEWDNFYLPNVSIEWLLKSMFAMIDAELLVENPLLQYGSRVLGANNVCLDLRMLKVIGYPYATSQPTNDDDNTILTCYELLQRLSQIFGWALVHYGVLGKNKYNLVTIKNYSGFSYTNYLTTKYESENVFNSYSQVYGVERFAQVTGGTSRNYYKSTTKTQLSNFGYLTASVENYQYPYPDNLKILVRDSSTNYHISTISGVEEYLSIDMLADSYKKTYNNDYVKLDMEFKTSSYADALNKPVKELWLDIKNDRFKVVQ